MMTAMVWAISIVGVAYWAAGEVLSGHWSLRRAAASTFRRAKRILRAMRRRREAAA